VTEAEAEVDLGEAAATAAAAVTEAAAALLSRVSASFTLRRPTVADAEDGQLLVLAVLEEPVGHCGGALEVHGVGPAGQDDHRGVQALDALLHSPDDGV